MEYFELKLKILQGAYLTLKNGSSGQKSKGRLCLVAVGTEEVRTDGTELQRHTVTLPKNVVKSGA